MLTTSRLDMLLNAFPKARIGVIGDFCLDVYWIIDMQASEISVETNQPTHPVHEQRYTLGGAGNVVANLRELGVGTVRAFGVIGQDPFGDKQLALLRGWGATDEDMVTADSTAWQTLAYCKPYIGDDELSRIDMGNFNRLADHLADRLLQNLERRLPELDLIIVNQQIINGIHTAYLRDQLKQLMARHPGTPFVFDGRHYTDSYPDAILKVNSHEACRLCGIRKEIGDLVLREEALKAAKILFRKTGKTIFITRGERGSLAVSAAGMDEIPGLLIIDKVDPVGAGDSYLAGVAAALAVGAVPAEAAAMGGFVAGVTVTKLKQTGTATPAEVRRCGADPDFIFEPELAVNPRWAKFWKETQIEIVCKSPAKLNLRYAIFDHDGTISTLRQGWEEVMEPVMLKAILGDRYATVDEALYHKVADRVRRFIDQTTGIQTLVQMQGLAAMVREFGLVSPTKILNEFGYKAIYNEALMERVREREKRLASGELTVEDFVLKNAVKLLHALKAAGLRLYLASGTDEEDVIAEACAMGYADLFEGRIYGAVGDVAKEAKRMVLDRILGEIGPAAAGQLVTFGDGPVEIRETRRRGGLAVGVASDEVRRFGLNPAKRTRLIRAGAAIIVPDFSQLDALLRYLKIA